MSKTQMEKCCECIMDVFHKYSIKKKDHDRLSKGEFCDMMKEQFTNYIQNTKDCKAIDHLFDELDKNKDQEMNFEEFMTLVGRFMIQCHENFHKH